MKNTSSTLIIIPTYNERLNIEALLTQIYTILPTTHVLVVDDNSPDGTSQLIQSLQTQTLFKNQLHLLTRAGKLGLGSAYIAGFKWALAHDYEYIFEMDADFSHNPEYLPEFLRITETGANLILGSRYVPGGGTRNWSALRKFISRGGSVYARAWLGMPFRDLTGGFKCFHRNVLAKMDLDSVASNGYAFQIELTYRAWLAGATIQEIPIIFVDRYAGQSKMSKKIVLEAIKLVPWLRFHVKQQSQAIDTSKIESD